ncbi:glycosyltransferase family 4 protein [Conexibacter sp. CPCC 206217]|uniref:glycosyltransferase family 4 protein n=1 Tax=Conexibacter sp. CPCC 206217 TaxID=3064574 RepID=UPI002722F83A|nr:glycosyltransferase family 4 protein [Conexibacter sp. CPCC 206217]MDO8210001.1 glycosyltransferase family 4 protein [Conexibacter sp. CPCC 206217]
MAIDRVAAAAGIEPDDVIVLHGGDGWERAERARVVFAVDLDPAGSSLDAIAAARRGAEAAGWTTAYAGLVHPDTSGDHATHTEGALVIACRADDELVQLLDNGPLSLALDPAIAGSPATTRPARVLIASYEITGPTGNGGIGTAYHSLAHVLAAAGNDVTLLFTGWMAPEAATGEPEWKRRFAARGIDFSILGTPWDTPVRSPHHAVRRAYEFHRWLLEAHAAHPFDVVHLPETLGHGAFAMTAKALGLAYEGVEFVIGTHSSTRWVAECNREGIEDVDLLVTERLERLSVARADVVMSPSAYLLDYMRARGWTMPERTFVQPYARPQSVRQMAADSERRASGPAPTELVFFGRLETRKGLEAFCDAVDLLVGDGADCPFDSVTFVGRPERVMGEDATAFVTRRASAWDLTWKILPDLGHDEAIAYLRETPCVVAIPSLVDNSPNTVYEAVALGVPFIASRSGGTAEIIAAEDLAVSTFDGWSNATALEPPTFADAEEPFDAAALAAALRAKAADHEASVSPAVSDVACDRVYDHWHRAIASRPRVTAPASSGLPTAAVCIVDAEGDDVRRIGAALAAGTRQPAQIVAMLAESVGSDADAAEELPAGIELVRASGRGEGVARRALTERLDADVLIVLRGREQPDATLVERVCAAFAAGDADVLSMICRDADAERRTGVPESLRNTSASPDLRAFVPIAGPPVAAAIYPALAIGPYAIRLTALVRAGGYAADTWGETIDHELLARLALDGVRFDVHPDPLAATVRDDAWSEVRSRFLGSSAIPTPEGEAQIRRLRPFRRALGDDLRDLPALLAGAQRAFNGEAGVREQLVLQYEERLAEFAKLVDVYEGNLAEHRYLIALYERQKEEMRVALAGRGTPARAARTRLATQRLRRAARGPVSGWPARGARFARWRLELVRRKLR